MTDQTRYSADHAFALRVLSLYTRLISPISENPAEPDLGGKLFFAGELDEGGRALVVASNIAGAASLSATAAPSSQRQAVRDGVIDFLVTSLDEALRILKNEIRKRAPVAVCIAAPPGEIESQMNERGVLPDLLRPAGESTSVADPNLGSVDGALVVWSVSAAPAQWMPRLDALALECLDPPAGSARRWVRMAPRYLGRRAQATHLVYADRPFAARFLESVKEFREAPLLVEVTFEGGCNEVKFARWNPEGTGFPTP